MDVMSGTYQEEEEEGQAHQDGVQLARRLARHNHLPISPADLVDLCARVLGWGQGRRDYRYVLKYGRIAIRLGTFIYLVAEVRAERGHGGEHNAHVGPVQPLDDGRRDAAALDEDAVSVLENR